MITVQEVDNIIANATPLNSVEVIDFKHCNGRVLAEEISADRDFPPFDRVMMDGIAIRYTDWEAGIRKFKVQGLSAAGTPATTLNESGYCIEAMTGAVCPLYADTIIKYEHITIENGEASVEKDHEVQAYQHIHPQGSDRKKGDILLKLGKKITASEIGVLATVGKTKVKVYSRAKIAIVATGDELVEISDTPLPHQIRKSNVYNLQAHLETHGYNSSVYHILDSKSKLRTQLKKVLTNNQVVVLSGGVSKGKLDFVPEILTELGVKKEFHFVKQRPGKPFWFGTYTNGAVFALPGNPNSSFVGLNRYVLPYLQRSEGTTPPQIYAQLAAPFSFKPDLTYFLQVTLHYNSKGCLMATPLPGHGSGDLANLVDADGLLELPQGKNNFEKGEVYPCIPYRF